MFRRKQEMPRTMKEITDLTRALAWPVFAFVVLIIFYGPLRQLFNRLPDIASRSESIKIGGVEIRARTLPLPAADVRDVVAALSFQDVRLILNNNYQVGWTYQQQEQQMPQWRPLFDLSLAEEMNKAEMDKLNKEQGLNYKFGVKVTDSYVRVRNYLVDLTLDLLFTKPGSGKLRSASK